jgi:hypothetical protein
VEVVCTITAWLLGFGLAVAFVPQAYADVNVGRWAVAWLCVALLIWIIPSVRWSLAGSVLLVLALVSFAWAPEPLNAINGFLQIVLLAAAFVVGRAIGGRDVFEGAAWGMIVNSGLAVCQFLGWHPVMEVSTASPAGLFGNRDFMAEAALLVITPMVWQRRWAMGVALLPALLLPMDRSVVVAGGAVVAVVTWRVSRMVTVTALSAVFVLVTAATLSVEKSRSAMDRYFLWTDTIQGLTVMGRGIGQFYNTFPEAATHQPLERIRSDHAHNDWLELTYELGIVGIVLAGVLSFGVLSGPTGWEKSVFLALCVMSCFAFPLHNPATAVLGLVAAGGVYRRRDMECCGLAGSPMDCLFCAFERKADAWDSKRGQALSDQPVLSRGFGRMADAQSNSSRSGNRGNQFLPAARSLFARCNTLTHELRVAVGFARGSAGGRTDVAEDHACGSHCLSV